MHVPSAAIRPRLEILAQAPVPTRHGLFQMSVFHSGTPDTRSGLSPDHVAMVLGNLRGESNVLVRVHSECFTSEVMGSLKCDCREQLDAAQLAIGLARQGAIIYLRQEGRGIGLTNKLRAYELQARGHDTVDANRLLGLPDDAREYSAAAGMLDHLGVTSIRLMTNNPAKVAALRALGVRIAARVPIVARENAFSAPYLEAKRIRMGHSLPASQDATSPTAEP